MSMKDKKRQQEFEASIQTLSKEMDLFERLVQTHWQNFIYIGVAVIVIVAAGLTFMSVKNSGDTKEALALLKADTVESLRAVIKQYPSAPLAAYARTRLAAKLFEDKKYDDALALYEAVAKTAGDVRWQATLDAASVLEAKGDKAAAATRFKETLDNAAAPALYRCQAGFEAGRIYAALKDKEKAVACLKGCLAHKASDPETNWTLWPEQAQKTLDSLN